MYPLQHVFSMQTALNLHNSEEHKFKFLCSHRKCRLEVSSAAALKKHEKCHKTCDFMCDKCGASYPFLSELEQHSYIHIDDRLFKCKYLNCKAKYKTKYEAHRHYRRHFLKSFCWTEVHFVGPLVPSALDFR